MCCGSLFLTPIPPPLLACFSICFPLEARDELLNPENDTIGILVSTAVEITVGGKTIKPAGGLSSERGDKILVRCLKFFQSEAQIITHLCLLTLCVDASVLCICLLGFVFASVIFKSVLMNLFS